MAEAKTSHKALAFYTDVLGFKKSKEIPIGEFKWLTVVSPDRHPDIELVFEPNANPAAKIYQEALFKQGIPFTAFEVEEIDSETQRLKKKRVKFTMDPTDAGPGKDCYFFRHVREFDSDIPLAREKPCDD